MSKRIMVWTMVIAMAMLLGAIQAAEETKSVIVRSTLYPIDNCVVCNKPLGSQGKIVQAEYKGQQVQFCSQTCADSFSWMKKGKYLEERNKRVVADQVDLYPLKVCPLMPEWKLGDTHRRWRDVVYQGQMVRLCCAICESKFDKAPETVMAQLSQTQVNTQVPDYPLTNCVVDDQPLGSRGPIIEYLYRGQLIRLCSRDCIAPLEKDIVSFQNKIKSAKASTESVKKNASIKPGEK